MLDLIERLEQATGPDRVLDLHIERHVNTSTLHDDWLDHHPEAAKHYTASLDAALTLVPEGYSPNVGHAPEWCRSGGAKSWAADVMGPVRWIKSDVGEEADYDNYMGQANHPALALCIAALKARASQARPDEPPAPQNKAEVPK